MPEEDGLWLVGEVRKLPPERGGQVPALAVTAHTREYSRAAALAAGFQAYLVKPINPPEVCIGVTHLVGRAA